MIKNDTRLERKQKLPSLSRLKSHEGHFDLVSSKWEEAGKRWRNHDVIKVWAPQWYFGFVTCSVWPKWFQSLICFYLSTYRQESSISKKNNIEGEGKKITFYTKILHFRSLAILSLASLKIYLQFDISLSQGNFIYFSLRFNHTVYQERSFTYSCNKYICGSLVCLMHFPGMWEEISGLATQQTGHSAYCSSFNFNRTRLTDSMQ